MKKSHDSLNDLRIHRLDALLLHEKKDFDGIIELIFNFTLKQFEHFKYFMSMFHQMKINITNQLVSEGDEVSITISRNDFERTTYINMYDSLKILFFFHNQSNELCLQNIVLLKLEYVFFLYIFKTIML